MTKPVYKQVASGAYIDLMNPRPCDINFKKDVAEPLAKMGRFNCHVDAGVYSVAQHSIIGADYIFDRTRNHELAACFLLHDAHEAYIGDITPPTLKALVAFGGYGGKLLLSSLSSLKEKLDVAIYAAAGVKYELNLEYKNEIKRIDDELLATERKQFLKTGGALEASAWGKISTMKGLRITGKLTPLPWPDCADAYIDRLQKYCPQALKNHKTQQNKQRVNS